MPPLRETCRPGTVSSTSLKSVLPVALMSSAVMTVATDGALDTGCGAPVAMLTSCSSPESIKSRESSAVAGSGKAARVSHSWQSIRATSLVKFQGERMVSEAVPQFHIQAASRQGQVVGDVDGRGTGGRLAGIGVEEVAHGEGQLPILAQLGGA